LHTQKKYEWFKVAESVEEIPFDENNLGEITANGKTLCVARGTKGIYACSNICPHASGRLSGGYIDALDNIVCPLHRYKFSLANGRNVSGEGYFLKTYPIEVREDGVYIGFAKSFFF
jgi:nitrite reductase/ring-hydroxylating ferredoxin subunit